MRSGGETMDPSKCDPCRYVGVPHNWTADVGGLSINVQQVVNISNDM